MERFEYVGFWPRAGAALIDVILMIAFSWLILALIYGQSYWSSGGPVQGWVEFSHKWLLPAITVVMFWVLWQATPGKMMVSAKIVDAKTGGLPSTGQYIVRYFSYFLSGLPLGLGALWVAFDPRKQGWHDKLASTVVVYRRRRTGGGQGNREAGENGDTSQITLPPDTPSDTTTPSQPPEPTP